MSGVDPGFWQGKRVFLTGHTGFKGSWLSLWLSDMGALVTGYALAPDTTPSLFDDIDVQGLIHEHVVGDVRDRETLTSAMDKAQPDVVLHLAAQALVRESYASPVATYATNVMGTVHLLEAVRSCDSVRVVVCVTTDKVYENREWSWGYRETDQLGGHDPYSSSKACAEILSSSWSRSFLAERGVALATARAGNVIGGGDWSEDRLVPDAARAFASGRPLVVRNPSATRPWQHVVEPLRGYLVLAQACDSDAARHADAYNFGPKADASVTVGEMVSRFAAAWGGSASVELHRPAAGPHEAQLLNLDISRAAAVLGWKPSLTLDQAVAMTADWYRSHATRPGPGPLRNLMRGQIAAS